MVLRDPAGAFGVRRTDTGVVVVPAGTAMAAGEGGAWSYSFADPAPALTYQYAYRVTWDDASTFDGGDKIAGNGSPFAGPSYLTVAEAVGLAGTVPAALVAAYTALTDDAKAAALAQASADVDQLRFQGRRYDAGQVLQFPRVARESSARVVASAFGTPVGVGLGDEVWDWDPASNAPAVPRAVKLATLYQAASLTAGDREERLSARRDGLASQTTGGLSESYVAASAGSTGPAGMLCLRAAQLLDRYRLKGGRLL